MTRFRLWAPSAEHVELMAGSGRHAMRPVSNGWHEAECDASPGDRYAFSVDSAEPRPDPRSAFQPDGVHAESMLVDHGSFAWSDAGWRGFPLGDAVIYELHTGSFSPEGTFDGIVGHLDHLCALGVNTVELLPVATFAGRRGWGYDGVDLFAPHPAYGGPDGLRRLVDACHARGVAVIMDVVYNHLGPEGNYLPQYGPYFTDRYRTPWGDAVNYDGQDSDEVRSFVVDNALLWLRDYHCDGLRLDAVHAIIDTSAMHILETIVSAVRSLSQQSDRTHWVIAESDANDPRLVSDAVRGGFGVDAQWSDSFHHALHAALTGERNGYYVDFGPLAHICTALQQGYVYTGQYSEYRRRRFGRSTDGIPLTRFLGYSQNHDQVGNRAAGERLCHLVSPGRARIAAALTILSPFVPMLFQGEEWAASSPFQYFTDLSDPYLRKAVSEGRRSEFAEFGWRPEDVPDPQDPQTFVRSQLRWAERDEPHHAAMLEWYRALIALRRDHRQGFRAGERSDVGASCDEQTGLLRYSHCGLEVLCNLGTAAVTLELPAGFAAVLQWGEVGGGDAGITSLGPDSIVVTRRHAAG